VTDEIQEPELLERSARAGEPVSSHQLKRFRDTGAMPRPRVVHAKGTRGSSAFYPAWAVEQLVAVARIHRSVRKLEGLVIAVWWEGHWVDVEKLRAALIEPLTSLAAEARQARGGEQDPYEAADRLMAAMKDDGQPSDATALMRRRLNRRGDIANVLWTLLVISLGGEAPWEQEDRSAPDPAPPALELLATAAGVDRAMSDDPAGNGPWLPAGFDFVTFMAELKDAGAFDLNDPARPLREATLEQLEQAREDAILISRPLAMIGRVLEEMLEPDVGGIGSLSAFTAGTSSARALLVRCMLILRPLAGGAAFEAIKQLVESVQARYEAIDALRSALPQHAEILRADVSERIAALPPEEASVVHADIASFLDSNPQVARALSEQQPETSNAEQDHPAAEH
jgi:hypothetical protein